MVQGREGCKRPKKGENIMRSKGTMPRHLKEQTDKEEARMYEKGKCLMGARTRTEETFPLYGQKDDGGFTQIKPTR